MVSARWLLRSSVFLIMAVALVTLKMGCQPLTTSPPRQTGSGITANPIINGAGDLTQPAIGALVVQKNSSFCTGTLITQQLVVTAAHCVDAISRYGLANVQFRTDFTDPNQKFRSEYHDLQQVAKHAQYTAGSGADYDVAVLVLKQKVTNVTPIPANKNPMDAAWVGTNIKVVGYGLIQTQPSSRSADQKYAADIPLFQIATRSFIHFDNKTPVAQRKSACHGDSGGPALYTVNGKQYLMGVTSIAYQATPNGNSGTLCDGGAVSTRLDANLDFLRPFLSKYSDGPEPCKADPDCDACSQCGTTNICEPKTFAEGPQQCKPCKADTDCNGGICFRFANGYRCLEACTKDSCCPSGTVCNTLQGTNLSLSVCSPEKDTCPAFACKTAADCGPGEDCDATTSACKPNPPPRSPELCYPCTTNQDCGASGLCYGPTGNGRCTQPCGDGNFCPDGFRCSTLYPGVAAQCVPNDGTCRIPCLTNDHCPKDFACTDKFCGRTGGGIHGDSCDPMLCKAGLTCVATASGKNCMQVCGIKAGYGGTECPSDGQCLGGARCYRSGNLRVCIPSCTSAGNECGAKGGGTCSASNNCLCRRNEDCRNGYTCNLFTYDQQGIVGACVPDEGDRPCGNNFECRPFSSGEHCVPTGPGVRSIGEDCDSLNRCKDGLTCLNTTSGQTCFEDCTQSRQCSLGGSCLQVGRTTRICLCTNNLSCPTGRICETAFQGYGLCKPGQQSGIQCLDDKECPLYNTCKEGKCVQGPIPQPEPTPEPVTEPAAPEPQAEPVTEPEPTQDAGAAEPAPPEALPTPDVKAVAEKAPTVDQIPELTQVKGGCGCHSTNTLHDHNSIPLSLLLLLLIGLLWRYGQGNKRN